MSNYKLNLYYGIIHNFQYIYGETFTRRKSCLIKSKSGCYKRLKQGDFCTLWEKARVGWSEKTASKHVYYQVWNRSPVQVGCMRQVLGAGALGWPRGMEWGGRWEGGSGWGTHVNPWLIHVNVWQKSLQYCKVISLQIIKINGKKKQGEHANKKTQKLKLKNS